MGLLSNSVSLCQFRVLGDRPDGDLFAWIAERLAANRFRPIDQSSEELSVGWAHLDDPRQSDFSSEASWRRDRYVIFSLRRDQRRIPARLLREQMQQAESVFLEANPGLRRVPKQQREMMLETVKKSLLARTLPTPSIYDAVWDVDAGLVAFTSLAEKQVELFGDLFKQTFQGLRLVPVIPYLRAERLLDETVKPKLQALNQAGTDTVLDLIEQNTWLGEDFLLWLLDATLHGDGRYQVSQPGPAVDGEEFAAWLDDRLVISGASESGVQKLVLSGPQDRFREACIALVDGKALREAVIHLEKGEDAWRLNLKADRFQFASLRCPKVQLEKDDLTDEQMEKEALFFERMHLLHTGLQLFDSLFAAFLDQRLADDWPQQLATIRQRLA